MMKKEEGNNVALVRLGDGRLGMVDLSNNKENSTIISDLENSGAVIEGIMSRGEAQRRIEEYPTENTDGFFRR